MLALDIKIDLCEANATSESYCSYSLLSPPVGGDCLGCVYRTHLVYDTVMTTLIFVLNTIYTFELSTEKLDNR